MNIKLHTPKSLKMGSGMSSLRQFLLSLFATTVSIALTFGTAAIIDHMSPSAQRLGWAAKQRLGNAALGALFA